LLTACGGPADEVPVVESGQAEEPVIETTIPRPDIYAEYPLVADLSHLSDGQRRMIVLLIEASQVMDDLFWRQSYGDDYQEWLQTIGVDDARRFAEFNYGPWDRLNDESPFMEGAGEKPAGARFYPSDMSREEFEAADLKDKTGLYSLVRRDASGELITVPYHVAYREELEQAANLLRQAAGLAEHERFANYLRLRADALTSGAFQESDLAWMDVKTNPIELVIGPIET